MRERIQSLLTRMEENETAEGSTEVFALGISAMIRDAHRLKDWNQIGELFEELKKQSKRFGKAVVANTEDEEEQSATA